MTVLAKTAGVGSIGRGGGDQIGRLTRRSHRYGMRQKSLRFSVALPIDATKREVDDDRGGGGGGGGGGGFHKYK